MNAFTKVESLKPGNGYWKKLLKRLNSLALTLDYDPLEYGDPRLDQICDDIEEIQQRLDRVEAAQKAMGASRAK